jgi:DNA-binding CsgD family transcriptional regulator
MKQVLEMFGQGRTYREIANELGISPKTVSVRLAQGRERLGVDTIREAAAVVSAGDGI